MAKRYLVAPRLTGDIKDGLYGETETARALTGAFRIKKRAGRLLIDVQLKAGVHRPRPYLESLQNCLAGYQDGADVALLAYEDFSPGGGIDYERKFPYYAGGDFAGMR